MDSLSHLWVDVAQECSTISAAWLNSDSATLEGLHCQNYNNVHCLVTRLSLQELNIGISWKGSRACEWLQKEHRVSLARAYFEQTNLPGCRWLLGLRNFFSVGDLWSMLRQVVKKDNLNIIQWLTSTHPEIMVTKSQARELLKLAVKHGNVPTFFWLVQTWFKPGFSLPDKSLVIELLRSAATQGHIDMCKLLHIILVKITGQEWWRIVALEGARVGHLHICQNALLKPISEYMPKNWANKKCNVRFSWKLLSGSCNYKSSDRASCKVQGCNNWQVIKWAFETFGRPVLQKHDGTGLALVNEKKMEKFIEIAMLSLIKGKSLEGLEWLQNTFGSTPFWSKALESVFIKRQPEYVLQCAVESDNVDLCQWVLNNVGLGTNMETDMLFAIAIARGNMIMLEWLAIKFPYEYSMSTTMQLAQAVSHGHCHMLDKLMKDHSQKTRGMGGSAMFKRAAEHGQVNMCQHILKTFAKHYNDPVNPQAKLSDWFTPPEMQRMLDFATVHGHLEMCLWITGQEYKLTLKPTTTNFSRRHLAQRQWAFDRFDSHNEQGFVDLFGVDGVRTSMWRFLTQ